MGISLLSQFFVICTLSTFYITSFIHSQCLDDQKTLLLELKAELIFNSSVSSKLAQWNQTADCCNWEGVECDGAGHAISLQLDHEMISGGIDNSSTLFNFKYLEKLNLAYNNFSGVQIPWRIHNLTRLTHLNLSYSGFGGQVSSELSLARRLVSLDLSFNHRSTPPLEIVQPNLRMLLQNLTRLRELNFDTVHISSQGSEWCQVISSSLPELRKLSLRYCDLSGPLDHSLSKLHSLSVLQLDGNDLSTSVLDFIANFSSLTTLSLSSCSLKGHFPEIIFQLPTLQSLNLSNNMLLSGTIPEFHQTGSFRTIGLANTSFSGSLPDSISKLSMLSDMRLSFGNFTGPIPSTLANLTQLVHVDLSNNLFSGSIPSFQMSKKLVHVDLSNNLFNGSVPSFQMSKKLTYIDISYNNVTGSLSSMHLDALSNLGHVNLGHNSISGSIPQSLFGLPLLEELRLSNNQLSGQVHEVSTLHSSNVRVLDLSSNRLEGPIPEYFFKLESLSTLSLSYNFFNGTIELEKFLELRNLLRLELSYNNLTLIASSTNLSLSTFPQLYWLELASCNLYKFPDLIKHSRLNHLDLSNNLIAGEIPSWIWEINNGMIFHLNLSFNHLVDLQKPYRFPNLLLVLDLHSNQFQGKLPLPPPSTIYADYSNNNFEYSNDNFEEPIPVYGVNFKAGLSFLSLANNSQIGAIPTSLCNFTSLQVLDLSVNNFSGGVPSCLLKDLEFLEVLNLGRNNLSGDIPDAFPVNCNLKNLDLRENNLAGIIPLSLARCKSLEVMNVGRNNIRDTFPCMLPSSLRILVLRSNRFHGDIRCNESRSNLQILDIAANNFSGYLYPRSLLSWRGMMLNSRAQLRPTQDFTFYSYYHEQLRPNQNFTYSSYYKEKLTLVVKGLELEFGHILTILTSIDFSCNNFKGVIPDAIGDLSSLYVLNLSHNSLTGTIPKSMGNLAQLGSLDLSVNQLTGEIPEELGELTFLSVLNLSYNKLVGMIPSGPQFHTFSAASFQGNIGLCGFPLNTSCNITPKPKSESWHEKNEIEWSFVSAALGFVVGLGSTVWLIWGCRSLRQNFFDQVDDVFEKILYRKKRHGRRVLGRNQVNRRG